MTTTDSTWDGTPIAAGHPRGSAIVVRRRAETGWQYLILHRANRPSDDPDGLWAWTPPSGMRQPGEGAYTSALRELAEETGITDATIHPVDLSRGHALWMTTVDGGQEVRLDAEHDRYEWLDAEAAAKRCRPGVVAEVITTVDAIPDTTFGLRPLAREELPTIAEWSNMEHLSEWFDEPLSLEQVTAAYGKHIDMPFFIGLYMITVDEKPVGMAQHRSLAITPSFAEAVGHTEGAIIGHYFADTSHMGKGLGPRLTWTLLREAVMPNHPKADTVWGAISPTNRAAQRNIVKAGFTRDAVLEINPGDPEVIVGMRLRQWF